MYPPLNWEEHSRPPLNFGNKTWTPPTHRPQGPSRIDKVLLGGTTSLFCYGYTSSGKTHTVLGYEGEKGLYHLAAEHLLQQMEEKYPVEELFLLVPSSVFPSLGQKQNTMFTVLSTTYPPPPPVYQCIYLHIQIIYAKYMPVTIFVAHLLLYEVKENLTKKLLRHSILCPRPVWEPNKNIHHRFKNKNVFCPELFLRTLVIRIFLFKFSV